MVQQQRLFGIAATVMFVAALVSAGSRCWLLQRTADNPHHPQRTALCDFQDVVYYPARAALAGVNPYDPRPASAGGEYFARFPAGNSFPLYAPLILVASLPFALLELTTAEVLYWILNVVLLVLYAYVLLRIAQHDTRWSTIAALATLLLICRPGNANIYFGAIAVPMALATVGSWWLAERRPWLAGMLLAVACIKPTFGGPLFVLLLLRGAYRAALIGLVMGVLANLAVVVLFLPELLNVRQALDLLATNQAATERGPAVDPLTSASRVDLLFVVERLIGRHLPVVCRYGLTFGVLIAGGVVIRRLKTRSTNNSHGDLLLSLGIAALTITLCIYHNIYDALLVAPAAMLALLGKSAGKSTGQTKSQWLLLFLLLVPALNYCTSAKFLELAAQTLAPLAVLIQHPGVWTLLCVLNGVCLTIVWIVWILRSVGTEQAATNQLSK